MPWLGVALEDGIFIEGHEILDATTTKTLTKIQKTNLSYNSVIPNTASLRCNLKVNRKKQQIETKKQFV